MRLFVAMDLPLSHRRPVQEVQRRLRIGGATRVRWVRPENLHWTVKFLGEVPAERCGEVRQTMRGMCGEFAPFAVSLGGLGAFPRWEEARVVYLEMARGRETFTLLTRQAEGRLAPLGLAGGPAPHPHLTLGRVQQQTLPAPVEIPETTAFRVTHISLFESTLTPAGPWYRVVERFPLAGTAGPE